MNSKRNNVWALTLSLGLGIIGYSTLSAQASDAPKPAEKKEEVQNPTAPRVSQPLTPADQAETPQSRISSKDCEVNYVLDNAGTIVTGWINLGPVSWPSRRAKCKQLAIANCQNAKTKLTTYAPAPGANMQSICNQGKLCVYFDTRVENLKYTKDGNCCTPVSCIKPPCPWTAYQ